MIFKKKKKTLVILEQKETTTFSENEITRFQIFCKYYCAFLMTIKTEIGTVRNLVFLEHNHPKLIQKKCLKSVNVKANKNKKPNLTL